MDPHPLISCLCVTRERVARLERAVQCFLNQRYPNRELIIVCEGDDLDTQRYLESISNPLIWVVRLDGQRLSLGALRNIALESANGEFFAQWDDDDWYSPLRLEKQYEAIAGSGKAACLLSRWTIYDTATGSGYISHRRAWEGSILCRKASMIPYPERSIGEDTPAIQQLIDTSQVVFLDTPDLYIYEYHGANAWNRKHWEEIFRCSTPLNAEMNLRLQELMT